MLGLAASFAASLGAADRLPVPSLPVKVHWSAELSAGAAVAPVNDGDRIYLALRSAHLVALSLADGHELWRISKTVTAAMDASSGLLFVSAGDAIEAIRGTDGATAWLAPRLKAMTPLVSTGAVVIVVTDAEIVALNAADGAVAWRFAAGGIKQPPVASGGRLFAGADDGRIVALDLTSGKLLWEQYVEGGVASLGAYRDRIYVGAGSKVFQSRDASKGAVKWTFRVGSIPSGAVAVDDDRVYFTALDNIVRGLDRESGNQRWQAQLSRRPIGGVHLVGHVVFVQAIGDQLLMLYDRTGAPSGSITLPAETSRETPPEVSQTKAGLNVLVVTGGLSNKWQLTLVGPAAELPVEPFVGMPLPGLPFLTDPELVPMGRALSWLLLTDPPLRPLAQGGWPIEMTDPPLVPLTILPGLQLRPLSPALPVRRGG